MFQETRISVKIKPTGNYFEHYLFIKLLYFNVKRHELINVRYISSIVIIIIKHSKHILFVLLRSKRVTYSVDCPGCELELGLSAELFVVQFEGAALFKSLAHVATLVFICPARKKFFPKIT
jgi:hypothetical protein